MKIDQSVYHLVVFLSCLASLVILIVTGHDNSPLLAHVTSGLFGGVLGGSAAGAAPMLARLLKGPDDPTATAPVTRQAGRVRLPMLMALAFVASFSLIGCAALQQSTKGDPIAVSCASASVALKGLAIARQGGYLMPSDQATVSDAVAIVAPICSDPNKPSVTQVELTALTSAVARLETLATRYNATAGH